MAVLRHSVEVVAVERDRLRELTSLLLEIAESTRARGGTVLMPDGRPVPDLRLTGGRHLRPGARYEVVEPDVRERIVLRIREWRRGGPVAVEQLMSAPDLSARLTVRLTTPERPRLLEAEGRMRGAEGSGALQRGTGRARVDLAAWWAAAELPAGAPAGARVFRSDQAGSGSGVWRVRLQGGGGRQRGALATDDNAADVRAAPREPSRIRTEDPRAPATGRVRHRLGEVRLSLRPRRSGDGCWRVEVAASVRGRWLLRPVAAVALLLAGRALRRGFRDGVERAAEEWNRAAGALLALSPDELRAELTSGGGLLGPGRRADRPPRAVTSRLRPGPRRGP